MYRVAETSSKMRREEKHLGKKKIERKTPAACEASWQGETPNKERTLLVGGVAEIGGDLVFLTSGGVA